jgi:hypothetical protein
MPPKKVKVSKERKVGTKYPEWFSICTRLDTFPPMALTYSGYTPTYGLTGGDYAGQLGALSGTPGAGGAAAQPTVQANPREVFGYIGQAVQMGLGVFSSVYGAVHGVDPATGNVLTGSGQVPPGQLGTTTFSGPGGTLDVQSGGFFTGTNLLIIGGMGLLAVILVAGPRR